MTDPGHLGDPMPDDARHLCAYGWSHGHTGCTTPATVHFRIVEPHRAGTVASCDTHTDDTRDALPVTDGHPFRRHCATGSYWYNGATGSWCGP